MTVVEAVLLVLAVTAVLLLADVARTARRIRRRYAGPSRQTWPLPGVGVHLHRR